MFRFLASIKLTIALLIASMLLVFFGTLDQVQLGIHEAQKRYFESFFVLWPYNPQGFGFLPLPGGYLVGGLLLINLIAGFFVHHKLGLRKLGIQLIHLGILLLLVSGFVISLVQRESQLTVSQGERSNYSRDIRNNELVFTRIDTGDHNTELRIPVELIKPGAAIEHAELPFKVQVKTLHANANLYPQPDESFYKNAPTAYPAQATGGIGERMNIAVLPLPRTFAENTVNTVTAIIELEGVADAANLGRWLVSNVFDADTHAPQHFEYAGERWEVALRFTRYYNPFWIEALEVRHDLYPGTQIPRNYSSRVNILPFDGSEPRQVLIYMNHPLRYGGQTFYQYQMRSPINQTTLLVVKNPGWLLPYIAVALVGVGMTIQFILSLVFYLKRSNRVNH